MNALFGDTKTDEEKAAFFLSGRGYETGVIAHSIQNDVAMAYHRCAEYKKELAALQAECDRLTRYYKNGIDCFANPCERHSGERTPPFSEFFEKYGGQCLICVVDNNKTLQAQHERLMAAEIQKRFDGNEVSSREHREELAAKDARIAELRDEITQLQTALTIKNGTIAQLKARNAQLEDRNAALAVQVEARQVPVRWMPMDTAPKDGTLLRLLIEFSSHAIEDEEGPLATIGVNQKAHTGEDVWQFVGWDWEQDCFTGGLGNPVGWLPMLAASPKESGGEE